MGECVQAVSHGAMRRLAKQEHSSEQLQFLSEIKKLFSVILFMKLLVYETINRYSKGDSK